MSETRLNSLPARRPALPARSQRSRLIGLGLLALVATSPAAAQATIGSTHRVETGVPPFVAIGPETIGLAAPPTGLGLLPDGRLLLVAPRQLALGDGVRWQVVRQSDTDPREAGQNPAIGPDGSIHLGTADGVARVRFDEDGTWRLDPVAAWTGATGESIALPQAIVRDLGETWTWNSLTGAIVSWKPGDTPRVLATADVIEHVFALGDGIFVSERFAGRLARIRDGALESVLTSSSLASITCSTPFEPGAVLAGTYGAGLQVFDGARLRPFAAEGPLASGARIHDVCTVPGGLIAAAVDNHGLVLVSREGRVLQSLSRAIDSRLARIRRLLPTRDGAVWVLTESGLIRVRPSHPVSSFEPLIGPGVTTVHPRRVDGDLWLLADGRLHRATYGAAGQLTGFVLDSPPEVFVNSFSDAPGLLVAGTEKGAWSRPRAGGDWERFADDVANLHLLGPGPDGDRWLFAARDELGWLRREGDRLILAGRRPAPGLTNVFNLPIRDASGRIWVEIGTGRIGLVEIIGGEPVATILDTTHGLPQNWPQVFLHEGEVRINFGDTIHRLDETGRRVVPDPGFLARLPGVTSVFGRMPTGPDGRLWLCGGDAVHVYEKAGGVWREAGPPLRVGFRPYYYTFEEGGVVWMHAQHRFARYDPRLASAPAPVPAATIVHAAVSGTHRHFFGPGESLPELGSRENSLIVHFASRADAFGAQPTFDVRLGPNGREWVQSGSAGSAVFNDLAPGRYVLEVTPVVAGARGPATTLAFTILSPWYRTTPAYLAALLATVALVVAGARAWTFVARRERRRLEHLVTERTADLRGSEARYRRLNEELEQRVEARTRELHLANARLGETNRELEASYRELESFSYSVSHDLRAPLRGIDGWSLALLEDYGAALDATGRRHLERVRAECGRLGNLIDDLLKLSQTTRAEFRASDIDLSELAASVARRVAATWPGREVAFTCLPGLAARGDAALLEAALANLLDNAWKFSGRVDSPRVEFGAADTPRGRAFFVRDNGAGFDLRHANKLFGVFQRMHTATEFPGTGIGLATVQRIVHRHGGSIWAESAPGRGATFYFTLGSDGRTPPGERSGT